MGDPLVTHLDFISGPNAVSTPGSVRLTRGSAGLQVSVDGDAPGPIAGGGTIGGYDLVYRCRAGALLGTANLSVLYRGFIDGLQVWTESLNGTAAALALPIGDGTDAVNSVGGEATFATGTDTDGTSELFPTISASFAPTLAAQDITVKFYRACRFRMITTPDANTSCFIGSRNFGAGVFGANSTTKFSVRAITNGAGANYVTSTVTVDTKWHIIESWSDGVSAWICVDGETPVKAAATTWWPLTITDNSFALFSCAKVTGVVNHKMAANWGLWAVAGP